MKKSVPKVFITKFPSFLLFDSSNGCFMKLIPNLISISLFFERFFEKN